MDRKTAIKLVERKEWGGSHMDSFTHSEIFRKYKAHDFGVMEAQMFSSDLSSDMINKKWNWMTIGNGNYYMTDPGVTDYKWQLKTDTDVRARIVRVDPNLPTQPGKGKTQFKIYLDRDWFHEPILLKTESSNAPFLRILGHPKQIAPYVFEHIVELQDGDINAWIDPKYLQPKRTVTEGFTAVAEELNQKRAGDYVANMFSLQSIIGRVGRKMEFTDKFIRTEIGCRKKGKVNKAKSSFDNKSYSDAVGVGAMYTVPGYSKTTGKKVSAGAYITVAEARLAEKLAMDKEMGMEFGRLEQSVDIDSGRTRKVAPGWRQMVRDSYYYTHNGDLTLSDMYEFINAIFITRKNFQDRHIKLSAGEGGIEFFSRLIAQEASLFTLVDSKFITDEKSKYNTKALAFGAQFTKIRFPNGIIVEVIHDPMKDNRRLFPELAPGTNRTVESFNFDIYDFGTTDQKAIGTSTSSNITMVMEDGAEEYWTVEGVYNFQTGAENTGENTYSSNKEVGIHRESTYGLGIWDITRVGRMEFLPRN